MRLSKSEIQAIKSCVLNFDPNGKVYLYGSRTDDTKRGGDIDLLIESQSIDFRKKLELRQALFDQIGEQKIDIVISNKSNQDFVTCIKPEAILL